GLSPCLPPEMETGSFHAPPPARVPFTSPRACVHPPAATMRLRSRVLIVDEPAITRFVRRALRRSHDIVELHSAEAALAAIRRDERYDVVLCDGWLGGVTGIVFHDAVRPISVELARRIVFLTGDRVSAPQMTFLRRLPNAQLAKPFRLMDLRRAVAEVA